jgi:hypothetical protein
MRKRPGSVHNLSNEFALRKSTKLLNPVHLKDGNKKTIFDDGTPDNNMEHAQKYDGIKPVLL